jgi:hypothetical protein
LICTSSNWVVAGHVTIRTCPATTGHLPKPTVGKTYCCFGIAGFLLTNDNAYKKLRFHKTTHCMTIQIILENYTKTHTKNFIVGTIFIEE